MAATLSFRIAGGGGFVAMVGAVRYVKPHKKQGLSVIGLLWSRKHDRKPNKPNTIQEIVAVGDWEGIEHAGG